MESRRLVMDNSDIFVVQSSCNYIPPCIYLYSEKFNMLLLFRCLHGNVDLYPL
jgi:hypothetical protein